MEFTIIPRSVWAEFVVEGKRAHAAAPPAPSDNPAWDPVGGVFIHYRGADFPLPGSNEYFDETDCKRDIAEVYDRHTRNDDYNWDIGYNFLICPHGNIYQGRGYERGEANAPGYIPGSGYGRNAAFYSICGLLRAGNLPTEAMLRSYRSLIAHLRDEAPRRTGGLIFPHSHGYATDCPGHLHMYAQPGSTIDPAVPWSGPADIYVYAAQKWVNATYAGYAPGYLSCPENGRTGWSTVYALTQGLQYEHGISPTVQSFGPATFTAVKNRGKLPEDETNTNLIRLYNAALWCKGYWTATDLSEWNIDSRTALVRLYSDAGFDYGVVARRMWPHICRGLMRMDQFKMVPGGDTTIRRVQQHLNQRWVGEVGVPAMSLVPCDGYYSRDVQQGFMMALQYELGLDPGVINGNFGPGTQAALRGRGSQALSGELRYLFRSACYFNSPTLMAGSPSPVSISYAAGDIDTDAPTPSHTAWLRAFQGFSQIPPTVTNDFTTWAQLLVSCGDTARPAAGCDGITEITAARGQALYAAGYRIVGRYLDEHIAPGDPSYLGKALKPGEPRTILNAGLRLLPIFQWNGTQLANFTYDKGYQQALKAHEKSVEHGIPPNTCIYFAVDYDALDVDIDSSVKPYFRGVADGLASSGNRYAYGVYGSRNVCTRVSREVGARWSLVSGMSWGFSGNLGFPLPENWSLNQIREFDFQPGWGLDHNVWRDGGDPGVSFLVS
ncbi:glycoside hydrolase domain-containing protein [Actinoplanes sp. NPDC089786]|uniref:glycoside hydrolase domain-containing protein n=1 Tax=Actinoplanes sp. NPDC089786 TaxID=3155185 RepID=UPI00342CF5E0